MSEATTWPLDGTDDVWFRDHIRAAREIGTFCRDAGIELNGLSLADVGTGDGIIATGVAEEAAPASLVAFDVNPVDSDALLSRARHVGYCDELPPGLRFEVSGQKDLPAPSNSFDGVLSWSAFEHIQDIQAVAMEISRVLRPDGFVFVQLYPLYFSEWGSHLEAWIPEGFHHLVMDADQITSAVNAGPGEDGWKRYMLNEYRNLNQARLDDIQTAFLSAGLVVGRCELYSHLVAPPEQAARSQRLSDLMIAGFKMLLKPDSQHGEE